jgi:hypothetical protein
VAIALAVVSVHLGGRPCHQASKPTVTAEFVRCQPANLVAACQPSSSSPCLS